jgi:hypothetical protein
MKLTAKTDLDAPVGFAYDTLSDFAQWEREAVRRGIDIERVGGPAAGVGAAWRISGRFRGKPRKLTLQVREIVPGDRVDYQFDSPSADGTILVEVSPLSTRRCRVRLQIEVKPKTLAARLFLNTIRLAKGRVEAKLEARLMALGGQIKLRHDRSQAQA